MRVEAGVDPLTDGKAGATGEDLSYAGLRVGVLTVSDRRASGATEDVSGKMLRESFAGAGATISAYDIIPDDMEQIEEKLAEWCDRERLNVLLTTGGTGLSPRDATPEATLHVIHREVPGIPELIRRRSKETTMMAAISRAVAGVRGQTLIINLPGHPDDIGGILEWLMPILPEACAALKGQ